MVIDQPQKRIAQWYQTIAGRHLLTQENDMLINGLEGIFGYHMITLGPQYFTEGMAGSPVSHKVTVNEQILPDCKTDLFGDPYNLPLQNDSVDVVVLPHVLEYSQHPHSILREIERVVVPDGYMIIFGFNPISCYGICRALLGFRRQMPWQGHFYHPVRLRDWIQLLGFKITKIRYRGFVPPIPHEGILKRLAFMEKAADSFIAPFGSVYMIVAKNQTVTPNIIRTPWQAKPARIDKGIVEPTTRMRERYK